MSDSIYHIGARFFVFYLPLLFSLCVHEWAHARIALMKGDTLALQEGRLSLNPLVHMDWIGTLCLPLISIFTGLPVFGWAKPVPVDIYRLKDPKNDLFWIALAGPLSNLCLSVISGFLLIGLYATARYFSLFSLNILIMTLEIFVYLNLLLCFFNLIPLHPLDGGKVFARFLPTEWNLFLEKNQTHLSFVLIIFFVFGGFRYLASPLQKATDTITYTAKWIASLL